MKSGAIKLRGLNKARCKGVPVKLLFVCLSVFLSTMQSLAGQSSETKGQIQGTAFVSDSTGQSYIANAKVTLEGPTVTLGTET